LPPKLNNCKPAHAGPQGKRINEPGEGRLLRDKGVGELLAASALLRRRQVAHRLRLVGDCDPCNPTSFTEAEVRQWQAAGQAQWLGRRAPRL
jgi:hypothetical protein